MVTRLGLDNRGPIPGRGKKMFFLATEFKPALGPTQRVPAVLSLRAKLMGRVKMTTHLHLVQR
jgi:hypothetical protein